MFQSTTTTKDKREYTKWNSRQEEWSYNKFQNMEPYEINRRTDERVKKVINLLADKYLPTHSEIAVGRIVNPWGRYKQNDMIRLNGNTRAHALQLRPDLIPPVPFKVNIYDIHSKEEGDNLYYSFDSDKSVETTNDKCTGLLRERDYEAMSNLIIKGKYKGAIDRASYYAEDDFKQSIRNVPFKEQLDFFWDDLRFLDTKFIDRLPRYSNCTFTALLMVSKKYGVENPMISLLIDNLFNGVTTFNDGVNVDGAHHIYYDLYSEFGPLWTTTSRNHFPEIIGKILFSMDAFINGQSLNKKTLKKMKVIDYRKYYQFYLSID